MERRKSLATCQDLLEELKQFPTLDEAAQLLLGLPPKNPEEQVTIPTYTASSTSISFDCLL